MTTYTFYQSNTMKPITPVKILCYQQNVGQRIEECTNAGYCIIGVRFKSDSPIVELLYDPCKSEPKQINTIHYGIENTENTDEEIPRYPPSH